MTTRALASLLAVLILALASCGDDDDEGGGGGSGGGSASSAPAEVAIELTEQGQGSEISVPAEMEAGATTFTLENSGEQPHDAQILRVEGDQTVEQVVQAIEGAGEGGKIPDWLHAAGGVGTVAPGQSATATDLLEPGTHYVLDTSPNRDGGSAKFEVTGEGGAELPETSASITAEDYSFETSGLKAGPNEITFDNAGEEPHHVIAAPLAEGATQADVKRFFESEGEGGGRPPVDFEASVGTSVIDGGTAQTADLELESGRYVLACFISDRAGGPPHVAQGMLDTVEIE